MTTQATWACRACGGRSSEPRELLEGVAFRACRGCGMVGAVLEGWTHPYAERDYYAGIDLDALRASEWDQRYVRHRVDRARRFAARGASVDLGAGLGGVAARFQAMGYEAHGVEESPRAAAYVAERLPNVTWHRATIPQFLEAAARPFDVVTLYHVLEHLPDLAGAVDGLQRLTSAGSVMVVEVPFLFGGNARLHGRRWQHLVPHHVNFFSLTSLEALFPASSWDLLEVERKPHFRYPQGRPLRDAYHRARAWCGLYDNVCLTWRRR